MGLFDNTISLSGLPTDFATSHEGGAVYGYTGEFENENFLDSLAGTVNDAFTGVKNVVGGAYSTVSGDILGTSTSWLLILVIGAVLVIFFASKSTKLKLNF